MKNKGGRPGKYVDWLTDERLRVIRSWKRAGISDEEVAKKIGITPTTLYDWKNRFPEFSKAFKSGKEEADASAVEALFSLFDKRTLTETRVEEWTDANGQKRQHVTRVTKEIAPSTAAIIFYLKAQMGWRDNSEITDTSAIDRLDKLLKAQQEQAEAEDDDDAD